MTKLHFGILLLFLVLVGNAGCTVVNYIPTASCSSPAGCDFNNATIWDSSRTPNTTDDVYITSNVSITIYISGDDVSINSLTIAQNVNFQILKGANVFIGFEKGTVSFTFYGSNCSLDIDSSTLTVVGAQGNALSIYNSTFTATVGSIAMETVNSSLSDVNANFNIYFQSLVSTNSIINASSVQTQAVDSFDTLFETAELQVGNATIRNSILFIPLVQFSPSGTLDIKDCETSIGTVTPNTNSLLLFSTSTRSTASINTISYISSLGNFEVRIGSNMNFTLGSGPIYTLYLGEDVSANFHDYVNIYYLEQDARDYATITTSGYLQITNDTHFFGSIFLQPNGVFMVNSTISVTPKHGYPISGNGTLQVYGNLICSGERIEVEQVSWNNGSITAKSMSASTMIVQKNTKGNVNANVEISSELYLHNTLTINGNFSQVSGTQNYTVTPVVLATTAYLQVNGSVHIVAGLSVTVEAGESSEQWLLINSSFPSLSVSFPSSRFAQPLAIVTRGSSVYLEVRQLGFWARNYVYILIPLCVVVAILTGVGIHYYQQRRARRKHYNELRDF